MPVICLLSCTLCLLLGIAGLSVADDITPVFSNQFVAQVTGGPNAAKELAARHGFVYLGQVSFFVLLTTTCIATESASCFFFLYFCESVAIQVFVFSV